MNSAGTGQTVGISPDELPDPIPAYLTAHLARDADAAAAYFTGDAEVVDEGRTYTGHDAIRGWLGRAAGEFSYTTELVSAARCADGRYDAVHHLEGDFPGGVADLHFRFTLRDGLIRRLVIEP